MDPYNSRLPSPVVPIVDANGILTPAWFDWFLTLFNRTGGIAGTVGVGVPVTLGTSPFVYTAPRPGFVLVAGNGVIRLEITAEDTTYRQTGSWYGAFPLSKGSKARLTYIGSPSLVFIPR